MYIQIFVTDVLISNALCNDWGRETGAGRVLWMFVCCGCSIVHFYLGNLSLYITYFKCFALCLVINIKLFFLLFIRFITVSVSLIIIIVAINFNSDDFIFNGCLVVHVYGQWLYIFCDLVMWLPFYVSPCTMTTRATKSESEPKKRKKCDTHFRWT